jgi:hypothetical protein
MPQDNVITLYSPKSNKTIMVKGSADLKKAVSLGWLTKPPQAPDSSGHAGRGGFSGTMPPQAPKQEGAGAGFMEGLNPFHSAPVGTPSTGSGLKDTGMDMLNLREISDPKQSKAHAAGMMGGTIAGLMGPELIKGAGKAMKGTELGDKALSMAEKRMASVKAVQLVKQLRGNIKDARLAETLVQPIRSLLDRRFEPMHKALEKEAIAMPNAATQLLKRIVKNEPEMEKEVATLLNRTALDYREADKIVSHLKSIGHESPQIHSLAEVLDKEIDKVATKAGLGAERTKLKGWYKEMNDVAAAAHTSVTRSALRSLARKIPNVGRLIPEGGGKVGEAETKAANALMQRIQGDVRSDAIRQIGKISERAGKAYQRSMAGWRAIQAAFSNMGSESDSMRAGQ